MYVLANVVNHFVSKLRQISNGQPFMGPVFTLLWRASDGKYWTGSVWQTSPAYMAGAVPKGQGMYLLTLPPGVFTGMDGDSVHWAMTDNPVEAAVTTVFEVESVRVLADNVLVRSVWTDARASNLDLIATAPTAAEVADAVWDELKSGHATSGSFGETLQEIVGSAADNASAVWDAIAASHVAAGSFGQELRDLYWAQYNRRKVDSVAKTEAIYQDDNVTPHATFDLKDSSGAPSAVDVFEKVPQ